MAVYDSSSNSYYDEFSNMTYSPAEWKAIQQEEFDERGREWSRKFYLSYNIIVVAFFLTAVFAHFYNIQFKKTVRRQVGEKTPLIPTSTGAPKPLSAAVRYWRKATSVLIYQPAGRYAESVGTMTIIALYLGLNILYVFVHGGASSTQIFANRTGLISIVNMPILFLLGSKTGLLVDWTGWSHEGYIILHKHVGRVVTILAIIHVFAYCAVIPISQRVLLNNEAIVGLIATTCFGIILASSLAPLRARLYEIFLYLHVWFLVLPLPFLFFHWVRTKPYVITCAAIFAWDRFTRFRNVHHVVGTSTNLSGDTVKLCMNVKSSFSEIHWTTGQYVYIAIANLARWQYHPFTIASPPGADTLDLIIRARKGFSRALFNSEGEHLVAVHGPYGAKHNFDGCRKVVLIAGGAGVSYTYPEAIEIVRTHRAIDEIPPEIDFLWVVPDMSFATWADLDSEKYGVNFKLWCTKEKGRPDIRSYVRESLKECIEQYGGDKRIAVAAAVCGPGAVVRETRNACSDLLWEEYNVDFHAESFGW
ncbi:ferric reductase like transmembrane component-domain-containing protein [Myxozyma melibiosi]|uniref:ferric-chelate reductase (NADPH) n=1 Tax=Myxozyma melibiosi TaxID=54550 RepID=A0ABR1EZ56_9ASCO